MNLLNQVQSVLRQPIVLTIITILFTLYGGLVAPPLPNFIKNIFNNPIGRTILLVLVLYYSTPFSTTNNSISLNTAILIAVVYTIIISNLHTEKTIENFIL